MPSLFQLVGRPRLNRSVEAGNMKPEKPKPAQAVIKQGSESIKMAVQNVVPVNDVPASINEMVAVTASQADNLPKSNLSLPPIMDNGSALNVSNTQEVSTSENDKKSVELQTTLALVIPTPHVPTITVQAKLSQSQPKIVHASNNQFVQLKPPTTTSGRVQSPNVKNFFIRKGIEKQSTAQPIVTSPSSGTYITTQQAIPSPVVNQVPANKKIIIKSQQIIVPANNLKQNTGQIIQMSGAGQPMNVSNAPTPIAINANVIETSGNDLSGILDLPILFADNNAEGTVQIDQSGKIITATTSSNIILNASGERNAQMGSPLTNIFINAPDGKLPNRSVVISAAKMTKPLQQQQQQQLQLQQQPSITVTTTPMQTQPTNKLIFINRNQIKQQIVGTPTTVGHHTQIVKSLSTLKLMPTTLASSSAAPTSISLQGNQITKLSPGTKIDLSTLKFVKNPSPMQGSIVKPVIINKAVPGTKSAILIKSPIGGANPVIKGNVLNRNITVRKVMNVMPNVKQITTSPITMSTVPTAMVFSSSPSTPPTQSIPTAIITTTSPISVSAPQTTAPAAQTAPSPAPSPTKTTRKTRNSN